MIVRNRLAEVRQQRGMPAAALAFRVGVNRQTIHAIEAQKYIPNTLLSLRLAQVLEVPIEALFSLEGESAAAEKPISVSMLAANGAPVRPDQPVCLGEVGERMIGVPASPVVGEIPPGDAVVVAASSPRRTLVRRISPPGDAAGRLIIAGCDPAMPLLARFLRNHGGVDPIIAGGSSTQSLDWLAQGQVHIAGTHLGGKRPDSFNREVIQKFFPQGGVRVVTFASWEEGLVVAQGNPKRISRVADLARRHVRLINREIGAGARSLLDRCLKEEGIAGRQVRGYDRIARGHILASWHVSQSLADCCVATCAAARVFGLHFIPLAEERYDFVVPELFWGLASVQLILDSLNRSSFHRELKMLGGYDTSQTGRLA